MKEAHALWGVYDIIASVTADTIDKLVLIITKKIKNIDNVNSKLTMVITGSKAAQEHQEAGLLETVTV